MKLGQDARSSGRKGKKRVEITHVQKQTSENKKFLHRTKFKQFKIIQEGGTVP